jgi:iron complex transport system permease protein
MRARSITQARLRKVVVILLVLLAMVSLASLLIGEAGLRLSDSLKGLLHHEGVAGLIIYEIRLPRTVLALLVGAVLGLSGAALQALLRNPLADASIFGAPQSAAFGAVAVLYTGLAGALSWALPLAAMVMAMLSL